MDNVGKVRNTRNHQPARPYDRHKSLLGRVSDSVKEMLSPSWLVDLVHSVKKKTPPGYQSVSAEASRSADPAMRQVAGGGLYPQLPRAPPNLSQSFPGNHQENGLSQGMTPSHDALQMNTTSPAFPSPLGQLDLSTNSLLVNGGDEHAELSDYTLPGPSCNVRSAQNKYEVDMSGKDLSRIQQMRHEYGGSVTPSKEIEERAHSLSTFQDGNQQQMTEQSFLWSGEVKNESYSSPQPPAKRHKPSFNLSLFGGSNISGAGNDASSSFHESSFYPGKTAFGGASSHRKSRPNLSTSRMMTPTRKQVQAKPVSQSPGRVTSSTARKILDSLERMSTPLSDVKKIPSYNSSSADSPLSFSPGVYRRRSRTPQSTTNQVGPPVSGLSSPGQVRVAKNLQKPAPEASLHRIAMNKSSKPMEPVSNAQSLAVNEAASKLGSAIKYQPLVGTREARQEATPQVLIEDRQTDTLAAKSRSGKMKRERSTFHSSRKTQENEEEELAEVPNLSTGFTLPASNISKIDLKLPSLARPPLHSPPSALSNPRTSRDNEQTLGSPRGMAESTGGMSGVNKHEFTFSSPISQGLPSGSSPPSQGPPSYKFSSPLKVNDDDKSKLATSSVTAVPAMHFTTQVSAPLKKKVVEPVDEPPVSDSGGGGFKPAEKFKTGSVMDFLRKSTGDIKTTTPSSSETTGNLSEIFKPATDSWSCPTCMVNNKSEQVKCPCCETARPGGATGTGASQSRQPSLGVMFSQASNKWECPTCMVSNNNTELKCPCCETAKPNQTAAMKKQDKPQEKVSSVKAPISSLFQPATDTWECAVCMIRNKNSVAKCVACENPNPNPPKNTQPNLGEMFKKPSGSWECDTCMVTNKDGSSKCIACEAPKPGLKTTSSFTSAGGFQFSQGSSNKDSKSAAQGVGFQMPGSLAGTSFGGANTTSSFEVSKGGGFQLPGVAVETKSGGFKPAEQKGGEPLKGGFKFGAPVNTDTAKTTEPISGGFKFGAPVKTDTAKSTEPISGGFKIGAPIKEADASDKTPSEKGGFSFGTKQTKTEELPKVEASTSLSQTSNVHPKSTEPAKGALSFGAPCKTSSEKSTEQVTGGFSFSAKPSTTSSSENKSQLFAFGSASQSSEKQPNAETSKDCKTTESGAASTPISGFRFGQSSSNVIESNTPSGVSSTATSGTGIFASSISKQDSTTTPSEQTTGTQKLESGQTCSFSTGVSTTSAPVGMFSFSNKSPSITTGTTVTSSLFPTSSSADTKKDENKQSAGLFVFGQTPKVDSSSKTDSVGGFSFKPSTESTPKPLGGAGFSFGESKPVATKPGEAAKPSDATTFVFGAKKDSIGAVSLGKRERDGDEATSAKKGNRGNEAPTFGGASNAAGFNFGQNATTTAANPFGGSTNTTNGVFGGFGGPQSSTASSFGSTAPTFGTNQPSSTPGFGATQASSTTPGFGSSQSKPALGFGSAVTTPSSTSGAFGTSGSTQTFGGSQPSSFGSTAVFGGSAPSTEQKPTGTAPATTGLFQFGAATNQSNTNQNSSGFNFSAQSSNQPAAAAPKQQTAASGAGFNFQPTPSFNFGASQPPQQSGAFQFGAASPAPTANPFSAAPPPANNPGARKIKRAVRKLRK